MGLRCMITQNEDKSIDVDYDIFSFAGRAALIGGGLYAIQKSIADGSFNNNRGDTFKKHGNKHIQGMKELLIPGLKAKAAPNQESYNFRESDFFRNMPQVKPKITTPKSLESLEGYLKGGYKGQSADLYNALTQMHGAISQIDEAAPMITLMHGKNGEINTINFKTKAGNIKINPVNSNGVVNLDGNSYFTRGFYNIDSGFNKSVIGPDVATANYIAENYGKVSSKEVSLREIREKTKKAYQYSDKKIDKPVESKYMNPEMADAIRESHSPNPFKSISESKLQQFMAVQSERGFANVSAGNLNNAILTTVDHPNNQLPFRGLTNNPNQLTKNNVYRRLDGMEEYTTSSKAMFLNEDVMERFLAKYPGKRGSISELSPEEMIYNKDNAGTIISKNRSITIDATKVSDSSEHLLKQAADAAGLTPGEFSLKIQEDGLDAFDEVTKDKIRRISIDDHSEFIKRELKKSMDRRNTLLNANLSVDNAADAVKFQEFVELDSKIIPNLKTKLKTSNIFGVSADGFGDVKLNKTFRGLKVQDMKVENGKLTLGLRREEQIAKGQKFFDPSGQFKSVAKHVFSNVEENLTSVWKEYLGVNQLPDHITKAIKGVNIIAPASAMKTDITERNAFSHIYGTLQQAYDSGDKELISVMEDLNFNYKNMSGDEQLGVFKKLNEIAEKRGKTLHGLSGVALEANGKNGGFATQTLLAMGDHAQDMGFGGDAFVSERHYRLMESLGLKNTAKEILGSVSDATAIRRYTDFNTALKVSKESAHAGHFNLSHLSGNDFLNNIFPEHGSKASEAMATRQAYFKKFGAGDVAYLDFGEEIEGMRKLPIFASDSLRGFIGQQIGTAGDYKRYADLDLITKQIIEEFRTRKSPEKLKTLIKNFQLTTSQLDGDLRKGMFKNKTRQGKYLQGTTANTGLANYAKKMQDATKDTISALPGYAALHDETFIELYGKEEYLKAKKTGKSGAFGWGTREPVEHLSSQPFNIVPASMVDLDMKQDQFAMIGKKNAMGLAAADAFGSDFDQDGFSVIAIKSNEGINEVKGLMYGNDPRQVAYRQNQAEKSSLSLKGRKQKSILEMSHREILEKNYYARISEKQNVGIISATLDDLHNINSLRNSVADPKKFGRISNSLGLFGENTIKGKYQTIDELRDQKAMQSLDALMGRGVYEKSSSAERVKAFQGHTDQIFLGDAAHLGDKIRAGEKGDDIVKALNEAGIDSHKVLNEEWFTNRTSDAAVGDLIETANLSKNAGKPVDAALDLARAEVDGVGSTVSAKTKMLFEQAEETIEVTKDVWKGVSGNVFKYAVIPAAVFGLAGTLLNSKSRISQEGEVSDGKESHQKSHGGSPYKMGSQPNAGNPKYMKPEISGSAKGGFSIDKYAAGKSGGNMTITDSTQTFDRLDMFDFMQRGY